MTFLFTLYFIIIVKPFETLNTLLDLLHTLMYRFMKKNRFFFKF